MPEFDVCIIGGGVVGCAIARELSHYKLAVALVEAANDVGAGTSKANTAILHTGFDSTPGSLEARLLARGYERMCAYAAVANIPVERTGALMVAWDREQADRLPQIIENAEANGVHDLEGLTRRQVYDREQALGPGAVAGVLVPGESIICPFTPTLAYATEAIENDLELFLDNRVTAIELEANHSTVVTIQEGIKTRWIINAAGLYADAVEAMVCASTFSVTPRRGQLIVFDRLARPLITHIILPIPTERTKGILVSPTVFGNILLGPTAEDLHDKRDTETTREGLDGLLRQGKAIIPRLIHEEVTATYAGLRTVTDEDDYMIRVDEDKRYICVGGIRSTGLSASLGIAEYVTELMSAAGESLAKKSSIGTISMPPLGENQIRPAFDDDRISENPAYGRIVCLCERVSEGEIIDALRAPLPAADTNGLRRRTRCLQGRCQGFHCSGEIAALVRHCQNPPYRPEV